MPSLLTLDDPEPRGVLFHQAGQASDGCESALSNSSKAGAPGSIGMLLLPDAVAN